MISSKGSRKIKARIFLSKQQTLLSLKIKLNLSISFQSSTSKRMRSHNITRFFPTPQSGLGWVCLKFMTYTPGEKFPPSLTDVGFQYTELPSPWSRSSSLFLTWSFVLLLFSEHGNTQSSVYLLLRWLIAFTEFTSTSELLSFPPLACPWFWSVQNPFIHPCINHQPSTLTYAHYHGAGNCHLSLKFLSTSPFLVPISSSTLHQEGPWRRSFVLCYRWCDPS